MGELSREAKASAMAGLFCNVPELADTAARCFDAVIVGAAEDVDGDAAAMAGLPLIEAVADAPASEVAAMLQGVAQSMDRLRPPTIRVMVGVQGGVMVGASTDTEQRVEVVMADYDGEDGLYRDPECELTLRPATFYEADALTDADFVWYIFDGARSAQLEQAIHA